MDVAPNPLLPPMIQTQHGLLTPAPGLSTDTSRLEFEEDSGGSVSFFALKCDLVA